MAISSTQEITQLLIAWNNGDALDPRQAHLVEWRFFAGLSHEETAEA